MKITDKMISDIDQETVRIGELTIKRINESEFVVSKHGVEVCRGNSKDVAEYINQRQN